MQEMVFNQLNMDKLATLFNYIHLVLSLSRWGYHSLLLQQCHLPWSCIVTWPIINNEYLNNLAKERQTFFPSKPMALPIKKTEPTDFAWAILCFVLPVSLYGCEICLITWVHWRKSRVTSEKVLNIPKHQYHHNCIPPVALDGQQWGYEFFTGSWGVSLPSLHLKKSMSVLFESLHADKGHWIFAYSAV